jgi:hypothetical protein
VRRPNPSAHPGKDDGVGQEPAPVRPCGRHTRSPCGQCEASRALCQAQAVAEKDADVKSRPPALRAPLERFVLRQFGCCRRPPGHLLCASGAGAVRSATVRSLPVFWRKEQVQSDGSSLTTRSLPLGLSATCGMGLACRGMGPTRRFPSTGPGSRASVVSPGLTALTAQSSSCFSPRSPRISVMSWTASRQPR